MIARASHSAKTGGVAIVGCGNSVLGPDRIELSMQELIFEGASNSLANAGLDRDDIDSVVLSCIDTADGRSIASMTSAGAAGAYMKHEIRTTNDGLYALVLGALEIMAGRSELVHVVAWTKMSEVDWEGAAPAAAEPFFERAVGMRDVSALGFAASAMMARDPSARGRATQALARNRSNALLRYAGVRGLKGGSVEPQNAAPLCWPLTSADVPVHTDGACGVVLATSAVADRLGKPYVMLDGFGWTEGPMLRNRTDAAQTTIAEAAARAYRAAGLTDASEIDVIELTARSSFEDVLVLEGLLQPLQGGASATEHISVNPSGGASGAHMMQAAGLFAAIEVVRQLRGEARGSQVRGARLGVAHGQSGLAAQGNVVAVFSASGAGAQ